MLLLEQGSTLVPYHSDRVLVSGHRPGSPKPQKRGHPDWVGLVLTGIDPCLAGTMHGWCILVETGWYRLVPRQPIQRHSIGLNIKKNHEK